MARNPKRHPRQMIHNFISDHIWKLFVFGGQTVLHQNPILQSLDKSERQSTSLRCSLAYITAIPGDEVASLAGSSWEYLL